MSFREQAASDLTAILNAQEISDEVTLGSGDTAITGKAVLNMNGQSDSEWGGGSCITATAVLPKSVFPTEPRVHEELTVTGGRTYTVASLIEESPASWKVMLVTSLKAR